MKIKHVQQEHSNDCVLACIAMITGEKLTDMHERYKIELPLTIDDMIKILTLNGFVCEKQLDSKIQPGNVYIATVPSLNIEKINHAVIFDFQDVFTVYDPNKGKKGKKYYESEGDNRVLSWSEPIKIINAKSILRT